MVLSETRVLSAEDPRGPVAGEPIRRLNLRDSQVVYRGEGNSSLVVAIQEERKVLRLFKTSDGNDDPTIDRVSRQLLFYESVVPRFLSEAFFSRPQIVRLSRDQSLRIDGLVGDKRPRFRRDKQIARNEAFALLLPDFCCLPSSLSRFKTIGSVFAVEIKPKQGFLPLAALLSQQMLPKASICRYCLSQFHKLKKGSIVRRSEYCPLDLFSGCPQRTLCSLRSLVANPQNNFRVFRDIQLVFGDDLNRDFEAVIQDFCGKTDAFCRLLSAALSLPVDPAFHADAPPLPAGQNCSLHANGLHRCDCGEERHELRSGSVLEAVLRMQKLDSLDSEFANEMLDQLSLKDNNNFDFLHDLPPKSRLFVSDISVKNETTEELIERKVFQFLVSLTAKDISIMIAIQRLSADQNPSEVPEAHLLTEPESGAQFVTSVCVTDLDEKSAPKIRRTLSNDQRMIRAFNSQSNL
ncbi:inositol-pentakisphosphate 2-kinase-like [Oppia nitens]|uniref:inositol-pentakisphosphate 2-kinase-like n=1 Tax=Oppia nitens TaxID=1686743 RepID=UPI0023DB72CC|nr:inositol-pentakisphosphate 2-kinase-like [Oppia nitens]